MSESLLNPFPTPKIKSLINYTINTEQHTKGKRCLEGIVMLSVKVGKSDLRLAILKLRKKVEKDGSFKTLSERLKNPKKSDRKRAKRLQANIRRKKILKRCGAL